MENEGADVFPGSPLAVIGLFVFAVRARFQDTEASPLPWVWEDTLSPFADEDGFPIPDGSPRKMQIESTYNVSNPERNYRPAIYIGRGGGVVSANKVSVDNRVGTHIPTGFNAYHCYANMPITFECEAETSGESSAIAETAWAFVLSSRDIFRRNFGFHEVTEPVLGDTEPSERDDEIWITRVQFQVQYDMRWGVTPIAPKLRDLAVRLSEKDGSEDFYRSLAVRRLTEE
jgi:hypothetical protein